MPINDWSFDGGYCKLKTARQKKRLQKKDADRQLLRMDRRQQELFRARQKLPLIPLEEPYQKGWKRTFVLRPDVASGKRSRFYETLLTKINTVDYSVYKHFLKRKKRRSKRKKVFEVKPQFLREFRPWEWSARNNKLNAEEKALFYPLVYYAQDGKTMLLRYVFSEPWRFVLKISPHMVTHRKMVDEVLEQEISWLRHYITRQNLLPRMLKLTRGRSWKWNWGDIEKAKYKNPLKNKPLHMILYEAAMNE